MSIKVVRKKSGKLSELVIPAEDLQWLKESAKPGSELRGLVDKLILEAEKGKKEEIIPGIGKTLDELREESQENVEELYRDAFSKGVFMVYQDERVKSEDQFIRANPNGSEDLVEFDENKREWHLVAPLVGAGQGRWAYLSPKD